MKYVSKRKKILNFKELKYFIFLNINLKNIKQVQIQGNELINKTIRITND